MLGVGVRGPLGRAGLDGGGRSRPPLETPARSARVEDAEREAWVVLSGVEGVGPVTFGRLLGAYGSAVAVLDAARHRAPVAELVAASALPDGGWPILAPEGAYAVVAAARAPGRLLDPVRRSGVGVLVLADEAYPSRLRRIELPPPVLFLRGDPAALDRERAVVVVGTRRPTNPGRVLAARIADAVGEHGATVVSGLALGIDAAAHLAAVRRGSPTVAVIGGGHERLYPAGHRGLAQDIVAGGGVVLSEFPPDTQPTRGTFPRRNRIISGLADATVVVEAGARSGALTTAAWALEQGRTLHLVPGRPDDPTVAGCLAFLREGGPEAKVVTGIPELLEDLGYTGAEGATRGPGPRGRSETWVGTLPGLEQRVADALLTGHGSVDELVADTGAAPAAVLGALTFLEERGFVIEVFGRYRPAGGLAVGGGPPVRLPRVDGSRTDHRTA